ncbi:MAG TPA: AAA family ATPase [Acidimicrobiia bacterium]
MYLLERQDELDRLDALLGQAGEGTGKIALVRGEGGIGKTSLVRELSKLASNDAHILWGTCDDLMTPRPLGPIWDMAVDEPGLAAALRVNDRNVILGVLLDLFTRAIRPTVVVVEDVHWADGATLDVITSLGRRIEHTHTLLVLTFRDSYPVEHPLTLTLGSLPQALVESFHLRPLSFDAVVAMSPDTEQATRIWELSAGNPLYVTELLKGSDDEVSASVIDVIRSHLARLTAKGAQLVEIASVIPGRIEVELVNELDPNLADSISELEEPGLVRLEGDSLVFRHELVRSTIESSLPESRRRDLHLAALAACESLKYEVSRRAHHATRAQAVDEMLRILPAAATEAANARSHREAVAHLRALGPHLDRVPTAERAAIYEMWAREERFVSGHGIDQALKAVGLRRRLGDLRKLGASLMIACRAAYFSGDRELAEKLAQETVDILADDRGEELAAGYAELSRLRMLDRELERAIVYGKQALALAPEPTVARTNALINVGTAIAIRNYPEGMDLLMEGARISGELGDEQELHRARCNIIATASQWLDLATADEVNELALAELTDHDLSTSGWHLIARAGLKLRRGSLAEAESELRDLLARQGLEFGDRIGAATGLAAILIRTGHPEARSALDDAFASSEAFDEGQDTGDLATLWAEYLYLYQLEDDAMTDHNLGVLKNLETSSTPWELAALALWLWLDGRIEEIPDGAAEPVQWLGTGRWERAAEWFGEQGLRYEQAVALSQGDTPAQLRGLKLAYSIGAKPLAARLRRRLRDQGVSKIPRGPRPDTRSSSIGLTARQTEVLQLMAQDLSNSEIARRLFISPRTVEKHVAVVLEKTGTGTRQEAVTVAHENGLIEPTRK